MEFFGTRHTSYVIDGINEMLMLFYIDMLIYHYKTTKLKYIYKIPSNKNYMDSKSRPSFY